MTDCCHPFTGACQQGHGCPVRNTPCPVAAFYAENEAAFPLATAQRSSRAQPQPFSTTCCHRPDCADMHCPGRPHRPPHTSTLQSQNSDGTCAGNRLSATRAPATNEALRRTERRLHWAMVWTLVLAAASGLAAAVVFLSNP